MATLIPIDIKNEAQISQLTKMLTLVPIDKEAEERKKIKFSKKIPSQQKEHIPMFRYHFDEETKQYFMRVPFRVGCGLKQKLVNRDIDHPRIDYNFAINLREHQVSIVQEAYAQLYQFGTTSLNIYTGGGKTIMSAYLLSQARLITCVYINMQPLISSWYNTFTTCFPDMKDRIWIVGEGPMPANVCLIICMYQRIDHIPKEIKERIGCLVIDEAHEFCTITKVPALLALTPRYVIICTATLDRNDGMEIMMHSIVGTHGVERMSQKPYRMFKVKTGLTIEQEIGRFGIDYGKLVNQQAEYMERNLIAMNIVNGNPGHKFMIFTKTKKHIENIAAMCKHFGFEYDTLYGSKKKFEDKKILLLSLGKGSTGFDYSAALGDLFSGVQPDVLIMMTSVKKIPKLKQLIGRVLRSDAPNVVYLVDKNPIFSRHFNEAKEMITKAKGEIIEVVYDPTIPGGNVKI